MAADGGLTPYLHVRADLWAKVTRALYYDLVDMGEERVVDGQSDVRNRIRRRILCDGGREAGEGRALNEPMLKKMQAGCDQLGGILRAEQGAAELRRAARPDRSQHHSEDRRCGQRPHARDRRAASSRCGRRRC